MLHRYAQLGVALQQTQDGEGGVLSSGQGCKSISRIRVAPQQYLLGPYPLPHRFTHLPTRLPAHPPALRLRLSTDPSALSPHP